MKCSKCGTEMTALDSFRCPRCNKMTCLSHRMPDRHDCFADDALRGIEVKSLLGSKPEQPAKPAPAQQPMQQPQEKKKRFGLF